MAITRTIIGRKRIALLEVGQRVSTREAAAMMGCSTEYAWRILKAHAAAGKVKKHKATLRYNNTDRVVFEWTAL